MRGTHRMHRHHRRSCRHGGGVRRRGSGAEAWAPGHSFRRRFATRDDRIACLEAYLGELRAEAQAVEERIADLQSASSS